MYLYITHIYLLSPFILMYLLGRSNDSSLARPGTIYLQVTGEKYQPYL